MIVAEQNKSIKFQIKIDMIVQFIWYFIKYYQDENEVELRLVQLEGGSPPHLRYLDPIAWYVLVELLTLAPRASFPH